jgi:hypothetical protein
MMRNFFLAAALLLAAPAFADGLSGGSSAPPTCTTSVKGICQPDGTSIGVAAGVISVAPSYASNPVASRFSASTAATNPIPFAMSTCTQRGTSQGGLTYTENAGRAWSLYLSAGTSHANSVAGWTCPVTSLAAGLSTFDVAFAASFISSEANSGDMSDVVIGMSDGTGVDAYQTRGALLVNFPTFVAGATTGPAAIFHYASAFGGFNGAGATIPYPGFFRVKNDGTNVYIYDSNDGVVWQPIAEWANSSKVVAGAYTSIYFGIANSNGDATALWDQQFVLYLLDASPSTRGSSLLRPY